ncbi:MAG: hypothetical protein EPN72_08890 [Nevskiaceae bacterium]|nr:MAG: hypothetical protein EPN63_08230 [Nevskiaceae bacterium]TBR72556.1 MAG: hypothetical protein EPN72_08890 [Nevskiaceae bacterium]
MPTSFLKSIFQLLLFRTGPQDVPYSPQLVRILVPLAVVAGWIVFSMLLPPGVAIAMSVVNVLATVLVAEGILRSRDLAARSAQTVAALLGTGIVLNLLMAYPAHVLAPHLTELAKNPELVKTGDLKLPQGAVIAMDVFNIWQFALTAFIYRHAANVRIFGGIGFALLASLVVLTLVFMVATLIAPR